MTKYNHSEKKVNIAMIGHKRFPSREGGVEIVVGEISTRLVKLGNSVTVYSRRGRHISGKEFDKNSNISKLKMYKGVRIVTVPTIEKKGMAAVSSSFFASIKATLSCINKTSRYDCIHYHAEGPSAMLLIPHLFGIKTVVTIHGLDWMRAKWGGFGIWYLKLGEKIAAKYADQIIVLSKNVQEYFWNNYKRKTINIPNGINSMNKIEARKIKKIWGVDKDEYILYLGRIVPEKGIEYLIDAFKKVDTNKKLIIAGGASDTNKFMDDIIIRADDDDRIIFTGFVDGDILEELYSNSYMYVLPSDIEGMPLSLLEAMSYGNCCLVSNIPECTEVVEDKAMVFEKGNVEDLYKKLQFACDNFNVVKQYKEVASNYILNKYSWNNVVSQTMKVYKNIERRR